MRPQLTTAAVVLASTLSLVLFACLVAVVDRSVFGYRPIRLQQWQHCRGHVLYHVTTPAAASRILTAGIADLRAGSNWLTSARTYHHGVVPRLRPAAYLFVGPPSRTELLINLSGRVGRVAVLHIAGGDLPADPPHGALLRRTVLALPGGYRGPAQLTIHDNKGAWVASLSDGQLATRR